MFKSKRERQEAAANLELLKSECGAEVDKAYIKNQEYRIKLISKLIIQTDSPEGAVSLINLRSKVIAELVRVEELI